MPVHHAVLALLADGPSHGYELKQQFEDAVGPQWGSPNIGHLYQVLERLGRDGLIDSSRVHQTDRPDRIVHALTDAGHRELDRWLNEPSIRSAYRDDFFLKLAAAARVGDAAVLRGVLSRQRACLLQELHNLGELERQTRDGEATVALLITGAKLRVRADLGLVEAAEEKADELVAAHQVKRAQSAAATQRSPLPSADDAATDDATIATAKHAI